MKQNKNTQSPVISVIVPVYKVKPYLHQCIDSILAQTFSDFELILVDDGSPDNCGTICDEYAARDDRIVVIHQENAGLSAARNTGIDWVFEHSASQWITFVDSDDALIPTCLEHLCRYAQGQNADIVATNGQFFTEDIELEQAPSHVVSLQPLTGREACISFYQERGCVSGFAWGKLYRRELFVDFRFPKGKVYEDEALVPKLLYTADQVIALRSWLYGYRQRRDSIVHIPFSPQRFDHLEALDDCLSFFEKKGEGEISKLAKRRKKKFQAKYMLLAHGAKLTHVMPAKYKMPLAKAFFITAGDTLQRGGIRFVTERIAHYLTRIKKM